MFSIIYLLLYVFLKKKKYIYIYLEKKNDSVLPKKKTSLEEWDDWEKKCLTNHVEKLLKMFLLFTFY